MNMKAIALTLLVGIIIGSGAMLQINRLKSKEKMQTWEICMCDMKSWFVDKGPRTFTIIYEIYQSYKQLCKLHLSPQKSPYKLANFRKPRQDGFASLHASNFWRGSCIR